MYTIKEITFTATAVSNFQKGECTITGTITDDSDMDQLRNIAVQQAHYALKENLSQAQAPAPAQNIEKIATPNQISFANYLGANLDPNETYDFHQISHLIGNLRNKKCPPSNQ